MLETRCLTIMVHLKDRNPEEGKVEMKMQGQQNVKIDDGSDATGQQAAEVGELASRIENDTDPSDRRQAVDIEAMEDATDAAYQAAHDNIAQAVADRLRKEGYDDAADFVLSAKGQGLDPYDLGDDDEWNDLFGGLILVDDDDEDGLDD